MKKQLILLSILGALLSFNMSAHAFWATQIFNRAINSGKVHATNLRLANDADDKDLDPKVLGLALKAYQNAKAQGVAKKSILTIIDYSRPSTERRLWVLDLAHNKILFHTLVAHGKNSGLNETRYFSNAPGSKASSIGVFVTGNTYSGGHGYSLYLHGLEKQINDQAYSRRVVVHGANYVNEYVAKQMGRIGRSWGCPAVDTRIAPALINYIKQGSVVFAYYPDRNWLQRSRFLNKSFRTA